MASKSLPKMYLEALKIHEWKAFLDTFFTFVVFNVLMDCGMWEIMSHSHDDNIMTCKCVFLLRYILNGSISHHKFLVHIYH